MVANHPARTARDLEAMPFPIDGLATGFADMLREEERLGKGGRRSEESVVGLGRLLRVSRQCVLRGVTLGKQVIIRNGWEAKSFW